MKNLKHILLGIFMILSTCVLVAQTGPPDPPGGHGDDDDQPPGGAPVGSGLFLLLGLGAFYGGKKIYNLKTESKKSV